MKSLRTCITPAGKFQYGIHKPAYTVTNMRQETNLSVLGLTTENIPVDNARNYPAGKVSVPDADWIFEIPNPFPFKGATYIDKVWADASAGNPERIRLPVPLEVSLAKSLKKSGVDQNLLAELPEPLLLALATCSTDPADLVQLAELSCEMIKSEEMQGAALGLRYKKDKRGGLRPVIHNHLLFEAVANNPSLPDDYKIAMVIRPGAQGGSEIVGEWPTNTGTHIYEYLRRNSYIAGGHYAANMAEDAIRYSIRTLGQGDIQGLRHLYYQRSFIRLAEELQLPLPATARVLSEDEMETLRLDVLAALPEAKHDLASGASLWGWNFGFDFAPSRYRLHASHQQIHQQYALVPKTVTTYCEGTEQAAGEMPAYSCGDLVAEVIKEYRSLHGHDFFDDYRAAIAANRRMDGRDELPDSLVVWRDERAMLFVPKAQTSQWELQLMTLPDEAGILPGNILECDRNVRRSLDIGILTAQKVLASLGARMVTSIEYGKRLALDNGQPLLYALLPRLPESPGAFSEAQLRFINGHYPEDFAAACRRQMG